MKKPAYLEISPRQTGKTERLITLASGLLDAGRKVCFRSRAAVDIRRRLPGALVLQPNARFPVDLNAEEYVWFFDEFDWLKATDFVDGGFYSTTPRFLRDIDADPTGDLLLQLLKANDNVVTRNYWPFDMSETLREARAYHTPEEFRLLYLGEFFK